MLSSGNLRPEVNDMGKGWNRGRTEKAGQALAWPVAVLVVLFVLVEVLRGCQG